MIILLGCEFDGGTVTGNLGASAYSYWFVLAAYRRVLERLGTVILVRDPAREVDRIAQQFRARGEECVYLEFQPPNGVTLGLTCPTIPVFAWEFETLPDENWRGDARDEWAHTLAATGRAITHSGHTVRVTRAAMGAEYDIVAIPAPVWGKFAPLAGAAESCRLPAQGLTVDTRGLDLSPWTPALRQQTGPVALPAAPAEITLAGVVYATVFNPVDSRKNWSDMLAGFIWALREREDATLVFKLTHNQPFDFMDAALAELAKHAPFRCRVLLVSGYLSDDEYGRLVRATSFALNASHGEGQCLPLMEFMSAGKPAITPDHTAMADYATADNAFIVRSSREPCGWPHDTRHIYRTMRWRIDFGSLAAAYAESYRVATEDPARYAAMSAAATKALRAHCSDAVAEDRLRQVLDLPRLAAAAD